ncbi:MAG: LPS export ABC transporter periplasmic protein LptC [Gammaproteobacteria bacterium]|nr:LPS export ABC transporter periplasmic protein LptC [Gammaproteobacteria bacterium]
MAFSRGLQPTLIIALLLAVVVILWLTETEQQLRNADTSALLNEEADYYMENFRLSETDEQGKLTKQLSGSRLAHFADRHTELQSPDITILQDDQPLWRLTAEQGSLLKGQLTLNHNVRIEQLADHAARYLQVETDQLNVDMNTRTSYAPGLVQIYYASATIQAHGMHLLFDSRQMQLHSKVRGTYVQP